MVIQPHPPAPVHPQRLYAQRAVTAKCSTPDALRPNDEDFFASCAVQQRFCAVQQTRHRVHAPLIPLRRQRNGRSVKSFTETPCARSNSRQQFVTNLPCSWDGAWANQNQTVRLEGLLPQSHCHRVNKTLNANGSRPLNSIATHSSRRQPRGSVHHNARVGGGMYFAAWWLHRWLCPPGRLILRKLPTVSILQRHQ